MYQTRWERGGGKVPSPASGEFNGVWGKWGGERGVDGRTACLAENRSVRDLEVGGCFLVDNRECVRRVCVLTLLLCCCLHLSPLHPIPEASMKEIYNKSANTPLTFVQKYLLFKTSVFEKVILPHVNHPRNVHTIHADTS